MLPKRDEESYIFLLSLLRDLQEETKKTTVDWNLAHNHIHNILACWQVLVEVERDSVRLVTEINRALRLLETDLLFLGSARSSQTSKQRLSSFQPRLEQVIGYCNLILAEDE